VTVREEVVEAMAQALVAKAREFNQSQLTMTPYDVADALADAVPADVLAQYAIEKGGLVETAADRDGAYYDTATGDFVNDAPPLYRLEETGE